MKRKPRTGKLRVIRGYKWTENQKREVLECGHTVHPVEDMYGEVPSFRRRCAKCSAGAPPDLSPEELASVMLRHPELRYTAIRCKCRRVFYVHPDTNPMPEKCPDCRQWEWAQIKKQKQ